MITIYFIYNFFSDVTKLLNPFDLDSLKNGYRYLKNEGIDLLTAKPYYLALLIFGIWSVIAGLFRIDMNLYEGLIIGFFLVLISFIVYGFSEEGKRFDFLAFFSLSSFFFALTIFSLISLYVKKSKKRFFKGKEIISEELLKKLENTKDLEHLWNIIGPVIIILGIGYYKYYM